MLEHFGTLKLRLALGAGLIGLFAVLASALTIYGTQQISRQVEAALTYEQRIQRYSGLAAQVGTFLVMAFEASQSEVGQQSRINRLDSLTQNINRTFVLIRNDLEQAVLEARDMGLDEQSKRATRSIGVARMEALFKSTIEQLRFKSQEDDIAVTQAQLNGFSIAFDPLINAAVSEERSARDFAIQQIAVLRTKLTTLALTLCVIAIGAFVVFYAGLVGPQLRRLTELGDATREIAAGNFETSLPSTHRDEIGALFDATNTMAAALAKREAEVALDQARLNEIVDLRTEELQVANEALAKTDADRRRFFADISHELRTPLTVILMETELALKAKDQPVQAFQTIQSRAQRLNRRIDDLLRIARSETGALSMESASFDLTHAAELAVADLTNQLERASMVLTLDAPSPVMVVGDANWARQVISGLVENVIRHAKSGEKVRLVLATKDGFGTIRVLDNGNGINKADQSHMMERFRQGKSAAKSEGFGIGLALARWIIEEQRGRIELTSPVPNDLRLGDGPGTMVTVFLPSVAG